MGLGPFLELKRKAWACPVHGEEPWGNPVLDIQQAGGVRRYATVARGDLRMTSRDVVGWAWLPLGGMAWECPPPRDATRGSRVTAGNGYLSGRGRSR